MSTLQNPEENKNSNIHIVEITSGQIIFWTCVILSGLALFFGLGVLTGRLDKSSKKEHEEASAEKNITLTEYSVPAFEEVKGTATPASENNLADAFEKSSGIAKAKAAPDSETVPKTETGPQRTPETPTPRSPYMEAVPVLTAMPPPLEDKSAPPIQIEAPSKTPVSGTIPATTQSANEAVATPSAQEIPPTTAAQPAPDTSSASTPPTTNAQPVSPPSSVPVSSPIKPSPAAPEAPPVEKTKPASAPPPPEQSVPPSQGKIEKEKQIPLLTPITPEEPSPDEPYLEDLAMKPEKTAPAPTPTPAIRSGNYGIQLAAFSGADGKTRAKALQEKLSKTAGIQIQVIPSKDNQLYRVVAGGFPDKESANKALDSVRAKTGFPEAFVKAL